MCNPCRFATLFLVLLCLTATPALSQSTTGTITGIVQDSSGAAIVGAKVDVKSNETGAVINTVTGNIGSYTVPSLSPGAYTVSVSYQGFRTAKADNVEVRTAQVTTQNVSLVLGEVAETVSVTAEAPLINPNSAAVTTTVQNQIMQDIPFPDRSMLSVALLAAGAQGDPQYNSGVQSELPGIFTQPVTPGVSISAGGGRPGSGSVLVDGADVTSAGFARAIMTFSADTVQEVSVQTTGIPAQYGRTTTAVINQTTRSGSNQLRGIATWSHMEPFLQTRALGAAFDPTNRYNQVSIAAGGPVIIPKVYDGRNKTFFWASFEPQRQKMLFGASRTRLPTAEELVGNFRNSWDFLDQNLRQQDIRAAINSPVRTNQLRYHYNLNAQGFPIGEVLPTAERPAIPNNDVSHLLSRNPIAQKVLGAVFPFTPGQDTPYMRWLRPDGLWEADGNNVIFARGVESEDDRWSVKADQIIGQNDRLSVRYSRAPVVGTRFDWAGPDNPGNPLVQDNIKSHNAALSFNHMFSTTMFNEFRTTYSRGDAFRSPNEASLSRDWGPELGLQPAIAGQGFPAILTRGTNADGQNNGRSVDVNLGFSNDVSWIKGRHSLKFGADHRRIQVNRLSFGGLTGGAYDFGGQITPNTGSINNFINQIGGLITGSLNTYNFKRQQTNKYYRWRYTALYLQDDFKLNPRLTLNVGLRWDVETPRMEKYDRQGWFDPTLAGTVNGQPVKGAFVFAGTEGRQRSLWPVNYRGFQPRVGLSYVVNSRLVWRMSYSVLRSPITGGGLDISPDLNLNASTINSGNRTGGVNPGPINLITNPIGPLPQATELPRNPIFFMNDANNFAFFHIPQNSAMPYVQRWNGNLQILASKDISVEIGYDGSKGTNLFTNQMPFNFVHPDVVTPLVAAGADFNSQSVNFNPLRIANANGQVILGRLLDSLRPYPNWFNRRINTAFERSGNSTYHALLVNFQKRFSYGLTFQGSYSWSKAIDDAGSSNLQTSQISDIFGLLQASDVNRQNQRGLTTYDIPHKFNLAYSYQLPFGRNQLIGRGAGPWLDRLIGGWQMSGIMRWSSGYPAVIALGGCGWFESRGGGCALDGLTLRPDRVPGTDGVNPTWREDPFRRGFYSVEGFAVPGADGAPRLGSAMATLSDVRSPNTFAFDVSMMKNIPFSADRKRYLQLRVDVLNPLNHPNFFINPNNRNNGIFTWTATTRTFTRNLNFTPIDPNNTAQFNNYAGRAFRLGARLYF
ncbi:MAG: TonB-dependent receptor [Bryobacteraceae bacterium]|nr:TonB-dependent receptor [Bryobacteraceae bacterium]